MSHHSFFFYNVYTKTTTTIVVRLKTYGTNIDCNFQDTKGERRNRWYSCTKTPYSLRFNIVHTVSKGPL